MNPLLKGVYDISPVTFQNWLLTGYSAILDRERYGGKFGAFRKFMAEAQWHSRDELKELQNEKLRLIIKHAYETVPYYRRLFEALKLSPDDIKTQGDLHKLPLLTREDIKRNFRDLISTKFNPKKLKYGHTSGTTGSPLEIGYDPTVVYATYAALDRQYEWAGCQLAKNGDRIAVLRGNVIVPLNQKKPPFWRYNRMHNQLLLSSFHLSPQNLPFYLEEVKKYQPTVFDGYPSTLYVFAKFLKNKGEKNPLKAVISSSETLYDFQRETIEESFQCRVFDYYALAERTVFATECDRHEGHHLCMEYGISEILDEKNEPLPAGKTGRLVGTSLHNYGMPLIRYVTNDMTALRNHACSCGRGLELMDDVTTKAEDTLTLKDGRLISPSVLTHPFKPMNSVEESQIIQKEHDRVLIKIVPRKDYTEADTEHLIREMKVRLGNEVGVDIEMVERLERTGSGKFRWVISEVPLGI
ncbi:MAG: phenylacetate--CoA ligase family protein [Deltaproteobacteria bacterium]|nr:phenylacetate--CoA ligase family protein [Deltaproteobacteria bacterium]